MEIASIALLDAHKALLYAMLEHVEDCDNIAKAFFPKESFTGKEQILQQFRTSVRLNRDRLGRIVNAMKHRQARLALFHAVNKMVRIPGYSVQAIIAPNTVGPDKQVHPKARPQDVGATSFAHELRWLFCTIFVVGENLAKFVMAVCPGIVSSPTTLQDRTDIAPPTTSTIQPSLFDIALRISRLPWFVYPQEARSGIPIVEMKENEQAVHIAFSDAAAPRPLTFGNIPGGALQLIAAYSGDGATTSFSVP